MSTEAAFDGWPEGVGRVVLDETDSTNAEAARRAPDLNAATWIMARHQTRGRGRRGRPWTDTRGNFAATLVMFPQEPLDKVALNSFIMALALFEALNDVTPSDGYALKWPNDVLLNRTKIAGILLESFGAGRQVNALAIGVGVNLAVAPDLKDVEPRATRPSSLQAELGAAPAPERLLVALASRFENLRQHYLTSGFGPIRRQWLQNAANLGSVVTARTMREETTGTFEDVDETGNLILRTPAGRRAITAADVFF